MKELQIEFEKQYSNTYNKQYLKELFGEDTIDPCVQAVTDYLALPKNYDYEHKGVAKKREDLMEIDNWLTANQDKLPKLFWSMLTTVISARQVTVQAVVGSIFKKVQLSKKSRTMKCIEMLLMAFDQHPAISHEITKGEECLFKLNGELPKSITDVMDARGYPLPSLVPMYVRSNADIGYQTFKESVIAGGALKYHDKEINLHHLNRQNAVAFSFEPRVGMLVDFVFDETPKIKDNGEEESFDDITKRYEQFVQLKTSIPKRASIMVKNGNKFYMGSRYDNRGRSYRKAFEFNYQSLKFIKGSINLHHQEIPQGDW